MRIKLTSVYVDDQDKALKFYTEVLGFANWAPTGRWRSLHGLPEAGHLPVGYRREASLFALFFRPRMLDPDNNSQILEHLALALIREPAQE